MIGKFKMTEYEDLATEGRPYCPYSPRPNDKVLLLMDLANVQKSMSNGYPETDLDFVKLNMDAVNRRDLVAAIAVDGTFHEDKERHSRLQCKVRDSGFRLEIVPCTNSLGKQEGTDVALALIAFEYALRDRCDTVVLITGDGDFTYLVRRLQNLGKIVEVISFDDSLSRCLKRAADKVTLIDHMPLVRIRPVDAEASP